MRDSALKTDKMIYFIIILLIILAGALRLYKLDFQTLDTDEISSIPISRQNLYTIIMRTVDSSKSDVPVTEPPLQYILMKFSMLLFNSDFGARLPAAILGIIGIWAIFRTGMTMFNEKIGLMSAFLLSVSFYHILYSQFARAYSALVLFSLLSLYYLWRGIKEQKVAPWIGFIVASTLNMYFHYAAIQVLLIEGTIFAAILILHYMGKERNEVTISPKTRNIFIFSLLIIGVLCLFLLPNIKLTLKSRLGGGGETIPFELNFIYLKNLFARYGAGNGIPLLFYSFFFVAGIIYSLRKWKIQGIALILWILIPFALLFKSGYQYFFHIRYLMATFPIFLIFVAAGVVFIMEWLSEKTGLRSSFKKAIPISITIILFAWLAFDGLRLYYQMPARMTDWKAVADYLEKDYKDAEVILVESNFSLRELRYYLKDERVKVKLNSVNGDINAFKRACVENKKLIYVDNSPVFDSYVGKCFQDKKTFGAKVLFELGKRELIDWDRSWFSTANIRRYFPVIYYNNIYSVPDIEYIKIVNEENGKSPKLAGAKNVGLLVKNFSSNSVKMDCKWCAYRVISEDKKNPSLFMVYFYDDHQQKEYTAEIELPVRHSVNLNKFPILEITFGLNDLDKHTIVVIAGIDYTGDGVEDGQIKLLAEPGKSIFDIGHLKIIQFVLFKIANEQFHGREVLTLTSIKLHISTNGLNGKENYAFQFRGMELFGYH